MTKFDIKKTDKDLILILDITDVEKVFVTEDETCVEITLTQDDLKQLQHKMLSYFMRCYYEDS